MFVFNNYLTVTGTIIYENDQTLVSGLISYNSPYRIETGCRFVIAKRDHFIRKSDETHRAKVDRLITHFGWNQLRNLSETGVEMKVGRTRLQHDGLEYRAVKVNDFGQDYRRNYMPIGVLEVTFEKRVPVEVS